MYLKIVGHTLISGENITVFLPKSDIVISVCFRFQVGHLLKVTHKTREYKTVVSSFLKFLWPLKKMDGTDWSCNEYWLQCCDISITSLFDNFSLPCSNNVYSLCFPFFTWWFIQCYWGLSLLTVTVFLLSLSKDDFMIMSFLWVCSKFFVARCYSIILPHNVLRYTPEYITYKQPTNIFISWLRF